MTVPTDDLFSEPLFSSALPLEGAVASTPQSGRVGGLPEAFPLDGAHANAVFWDRLAERAAAWLEAHGLASRDAVLLLPFAQHLAPARRAWMKLSRWQPRIETTHSLASALGPSALPQALQLTFDAAIDALAARQLLRSQTWAQALRQEDARAFEAAVQRLVEAAHALSRAAQTRSPAGRIAFWALVRQTLAAQSGTGQLERALLLVALEWAAADPRAPATDALFDLRPSAWLHLQAGGPDLLANALLDAAQAEGIPCLRLSADVLLDDAYRHGVPPAQVEQAPCDDFEDLAQCSAASVLDHLNAGRSPVALIAQDRVLLRRVRALLERQGLGIADETGWTLATTAPAAQLMAMLRATRRDATVDEWLAWLKTPLAAALRERAGSGALPALEARCRQRGWSAPAAVREDRLTPGSARLWAQAREAVAPLQASGSRTLEDWLKELGEVLKRLGADERLAEQPAGGPQLLDALWLKRSPWPGSAHEAVVKETVLSPMEFTAWISATLEAAQYVPPIQGELQVMITPLARAMLRPFGAVVLPGADAATLGPVPAGPNLISDTLARQFGLPTIEEKRDALARQFVQLLRAPAVTLLRCAHRGSEPLAASPLLDRLDLARQAAGLGPLPLWRDPRVEMQVPVQVRQRASAQAQGRLPRALSASAVESLRQCPYQFFSRVLLGLREVQELDQQADKRDYGTWLHAVLHQFHTERQAGQGGAMDDETRMRQAAQTQMHQQGLSPAEFLPFSASFARFVPVYLDWLREREAQGQLFSQGEVAREVRPWSGWDPTLASLALLGRIDRMDDAPGGRWLLDYKTGSVKGLKDKVADPLEDTQLAVYAVLMGAAQTPSAGEVEDDASGGVAGGAVGVASGRPELLHAEYLALDDPKGIAAVAHPDVAESAIQLVQGLGEDLLKIHRGDALPALGEGVACEYCDMRGLCRRDDWEGAAP
ncbi:ATP-dependent helicase/nuclease subunit B [Roseateles sp. YR242]|uniref:PD-(D/E)XK nuclease family protein n=1 Tax=Roseateles sp. YR242 TaxID=1855305 RepID=UPI0008D26D8E|nr:PD-(D/E)XK nuclease family protein [Roseateles sp. YR242]SEL89951.1 ATP-dependent helicase/nuclease subunit B [Roseateles sp. YR242]